MKPEERVEEDQMFSTVAAYLAPYLLAGAYIFYELRKERSDRRDKDGTAQGRKSGSRRMTPDYFR